MSFVAVAVAGAAVVGSVVSANSARSSARSQAAAVQQSSDANIQLAREERARNEALFAQYLGDEGMARAYLDALYYGEGSYTPPAVQQTLIQRHPALYQQWQNLVDAVGVTDLAYNPLQGWGSQGNNGGPLPSFYDYVRTQLGDAGVANIPPPTQSFTRDQVLQDIADTPLSQFAQEHFDEREELAEETYAGGRDLAGEEYDALTGQAQQNLQSRIGLEDDSYAAWLPMSQQAEQDAINLNFSRGGVTGLIGQTREGVGRTTQDAAMERNLRRLEGYQAAHAPYYDEMTDATALRGERNQRGYDTYSRTRGANYDQFAGDRLNSYADYQGFLQDRVNRGGDARRSIASGGQAFVNTATQQNSRAGEAAAASYARQGEINQQLYGDLAGIAGTAFGSIRNKPTTKK